MKLERASEGASPDRVEDLYVRYAPGALRLAYLLLGDPDLAEDCVQDAFVRVVGRLGHLRDASAFEAYLRRTIVNQTRNHWRRRSTERAHAEWSGPPLPVASPDGAIAHRLAIWQALQLLPQRQRAALVLRYYEDLPEAEVAAVLRCRPGTARSLISRGKASLRSTLERYDDG